jgi:hypothetical protein
MICFLEKLFIRFDLMLGHYVYRYVYLHLAENVIGHVHTLLTLYEAVSFRTSTV